MARLMLSLMIFVTLSAISVLCEGKSLPDYVEKCSRKDPKLNECMTNRANSMIPHLIEGNRKEHFPKLNPFAFNKIAGDLGTMHIELLNGNIYGIENSKIDNVVLNTKEGKLELFGVIPKLKFVSDYETSGKLLILPIEGKGPFKMILDEFKMTITIKLDNLNKDSTEPMKVTNIEFDYEYENGDIQMDNLFNGNKELSEPVQKLLSEENQEINKEFKPVIKEAFNIIMLSVFEPLLNGYIFSEWFTE